MADSDPRLQTGAYITDGVELFEVIGLRRGPGVMGVHTVRIVLQNCRTFGSSELLPHILGGAFQLVRDPPQPAVPDLVEEIPWEPALTA